MNPYAVAEQRRAGPGAVSAAGVVLAGAAGLVVFGAGTASAEDIGLGGSDYGSSDFGGMSGSGDMFGGAGGGGSEAFSSPDVASNSFDSAPSSPVSSFDSDVSSPVSSFDSDVSSPVSSSEAVVLPEPVTVPEPADEVAVSTDTATGSPSPMWTAEPVSDMDLGRTDVVEEPGLTVTSPVLGAPSETQDISWSGSGTDALGAGSAFDDLPTIVDPSDVTAPGALDGLLPPPVDDGPGTGAQQQLSFDVADLASLGSGNVTTGDAPAGPAPPDDRTLPADGGAPLRLEGAVPVIPVEPVSSGADTDVASYDYMPGIAGQSIKLVGSGRPGVIPGLVTRSGVAGQDGMEEVIVTPAREPAGDGSVGGRHGEVSALVPVSSGFDSRELSQTYHVPTGTPLVRVTGVVPGLPGTPEPMDGFPPISTLSPGTPAESGGQDNPWFGGKISTDNVRQTLEIGKPVKNEGVSKALFWVGPDLSTQQGVNLTAESSMSVGGAMPKVGAKVGPVLQVGAPGSAPNVQLSGGVAAAAEDETGLAVNPFVQGKLVVSPNFSVTGKQTFPFFDSAAKTSIEVESKPGRSDPAEDDLARLISVPANLLNAVSDVTSGVMKQATLGSNGVCQSCAEGRLDNSLIPAENQRNAARHLEAARVAADTLLTDPVHSRVAANISSANNQLATMFGQNLPRNLDRAFGEPARGAASAVQSAAQEIPGNVDSANRQLVQYGQNAAANANRAFVQPVHDGWSNLVGGTEKLRDQVFGAPADPGPVAAPAPVTPGGGAVRIGDGTPEGARAANRWNQDNLGVRTNFVGNALVGTGADRADAVFGSPRAESTGDTRAALPAAQSPALVPSAPRPFEEPSVERAVQAVQGKADEVNRDHVQPVVQVVQQKAEEANQNYVQPLVRAAQDAWNRLTGGGR
ncbi:MAG: hypothetical protein LH603_17880 [Pseudonocardia sp.]|nr:hypothetical protein [Pseudonocardia sp.]